MSSGHDHAHDLRGAHIRALSMAFVLVGLFMLVEFAGAWFSGSLALLSDAGHMATDALGLGMALAAMVAAQRGPTTSGRTYGLYRLEILAALANAILLLGVGAYVLYEAVERLQDPPEVLTGSMLVIAILGLVVNIISWRLLRSGVDDSINLEGAYLEVMADTIGSVGVIVAALVIQLTGWSIVDAIFGGAIGLFILPRAVRLAIKALRILVQAAPRHINLAELEERLAEIPGVLDVHDMHIWTLTSGMDVATVHLMTGEEIDPHSVLDIARTLLRDEHGIEHATLQVEPESHTGCAEVAW